MKLNKCYIKDSCIYSYLPPQPPQACVCCNYGVFVACTGGQSAAGKVYVYNPHTNTLNDSGLANAYYNAIDASYSTNMVVAVSGKSGAGSTGKIDILRLNSDCTVTLISSSDPRKDVAGFSTGNSVYASCAIENNGYSVLVPATNNDNSTYYAYYCTDITSATPVWYYIETGTNIGTDGVSFAFTVGGEVAFLPPKHKITGLGRTKITNESPGQYAVFRDTHIDLGTITYGTLIDGYNLQGYDMIVLSAQTDPKENGVYSLHQGAAMRWPASGANLWKKNVYINAGSTYINKMATNTNASSPTYGVDNISMAIITTVNTGSALSAYCTQQNGSYYMIEDGGVGARNKCWRSDDPTLVNWANMANMSPDIKYITKGHTADAGPKVWTANAYNIRYRETNNIGTLTTGRKYNCVAKFEPGNLGLVVTEAGNSDGDYIKYYRIPFTGNKLFAIENRLRYWVNVSPYGFYDIAG